MRASPACQVSLQRVGAWRAGVLLLAIGSAAVLLAWGAASAAGADASQARWRWAAVAALLALIAVLAASLWRTPGQKLRWDGHDWHLDKRVGDLQVAIDLGPWMLLRFTSRGGRAQRRWLALQRRGLEPGWHALRCAVYSPRPAADAR